MSASSLGQIKSWRLVNRCSASVAEWWRVGELEQFADAVQQAFERAGARQVPLIEDDVYAELYFGTQPPKSMKSFDRDALVMHCGSFSKCLAPGYRVGWVADGRYATAIHRLKLMTTISPSAPAQAAIADYLQDGGYDRHLCKLRHALEAQQGSMLASAARHFPVEIRVTHPSGGYFLWFEFPEQADSLQLFQFALAQVISLAPGPIFPPLDASATVPASTMATPGIPRASRRWRCLDAYWIPFDRGDYSRVEHGE